MCVGWGEGWRSVCRPVGGVQLKAESHWMCQRRLPDVLKGDSIVLALALSCVQDTMDDGEAGGHRGSEVRGFTVAVAVTLGCPVG